MKKLLSTLLVAVVMLLQSATLSAQNYYIEADGIGPIKVGGHVSNIAGVVDGLYDDGTITTEYDEFEDENIYIFTFKLNGKERFQARVTESGEIFHVQALTNELRTKSGAYDQMPAKQFIQLPGVKVVVNPYADYNQISFEIDGIPVSIDEYSYTSAGQAKYNAALKSGRAPQFVASDFNDNSTIVLGGFM
ncbi:MAG: hypothetical protein J6R50_01440 [Alistipes sp.]|nr:hypothetical protein [Alistipes sp.]